MTSTKSYRFSVQPQHVDFLQQTTLVSIIDFVLNTAGENAHSNGFGLMHLMNKNLTWVLSRFVLEMNAFPKESDELFINTWIENVGTAFTTRNFRLLDADNHILGHASSSWAIIDFKTRRSLPLDTLPDLKNFVVNTSVPIGSPTRIPAIQGKIRNEFCVKYSDIDINRHANTLKYVQWVVDCFSPDFYTANRLKRFEINFLKELNFGDKGAVFCKQKTDNDYFFQLETEEKGIACRARILFE